MDSQEEYKNVFVQLVSLNENGKDNKSFVSLNCQTNNQKLYMYLVSGQHKNMF